LISRKEITAKDGARRRDHGACRDDVLHRRAALRPAFWACGGGF
jgi:hypothetical protein